MVSADVIIIGGGAAGFFAAVNSAQLNKQCTLVVLEKHQNYYPK